MQEPTEEAEASIPTVNVKEDPDLNVTFAVRRKAAKRSLPWDLAAGELDLVSPSQAEEIRTTKKPRFEDTFSASVDDAATKISSLDTTVSLPPPKAAAAAAAATHADLDPVRDMHLNASATGARRRWTADEDTRLEESMLVQTHDGETKNWGAIAALVPGRTRSQCTARWNNNTWTLIVAQSG